MSQPFGGSGMDLNSAGRILDPLGIFGGGGMNKTAAEAFFDPAGIDSNGGLNLFGKAGQNNQSNVPQTPAELGNLGPNSLQPHFYDPNSFAPRQMTGGSFNQMAQQAAGPVYNPQLMGASPGGAVPNPSPGSAGFGGSDAFVGGAPSTMPYNGPHSDGAISGLNPAISGLNPMRGMNLHPEGMPLLGNRPFMRMGHQFGGFRHSTMPYNGPHSTMPYNGPMPAQLPPNWAMSNIGGGIPGGI
jgi:hypothetical protein